MASAFDLEANPNPDIPHPLETEAFVWARFREYFPFGDTSLRERRYQDILVKVLEGFKDVRQRELLLDMLDIQLLVFIEQVWIQQEQSGSGCKTLFAENAEMASLRLDCHTMLRRMYGLPHKSSGRGVLHNLPETTTLFDMLGQAQYRGVLK